MARRRKRADCGRSRTSDFGFTEPEQNLAGAVLRQAARDVQRGGQHAREARTFLHGRRAGRLMSYVNVDRDRFLQLLERD